MTRGNQRDAAREKNLKKQQQLNKGKKDKDAPALGKRMESDAEIMRRKQEAALEAKKAADAAKGATAKVTKIDPLAM